jgi:hypothetical protein
LQQILSYFNDFFQQINRPFLLGCTLFAAMIIWINYRWGIETRLLSGISYRPYRFLGFYVLYLFTYTAPVLVLLLVSKRSQMPATTWPLLLLAPAIFALKVTAGGWQELLRTGISGSTGKWLSIMIDWPVRLVITVSLLWLLKKWIFRGMDHFYGMTTRNFTWWPYLALLACMVPLVAFAATRPDFLLTYPKVKVLDKFHPSGAPGWQQLLYELSYGSDFLTIELFFRGFLVVAMAKLIGPAAILPMAIFYCSIHFGKPMLECISSYFGGIILGVIAYYSQSILGGILVHLGLAWMMELAAQVARNFPPDG